LAYARTRPTPPPARCLPCCLPTPAPSPPPTPHHHRLPHPVAPPRTPRGINHHLSPYLQLQHYSSVTGRRCLRNTTPLRHAATFLVRTFLRHLPAAALVGTHYPCISLPALTALRYLHSTQRLGSSWRWRSYLQLIPGLSCHHPIYLRTSGSYRLSTLQPPPRWRHTTCLPAFPHTTYTPHHSRHSLDARTASTHACPVAFLPPARAGPRLRAHTYTRGQEGRVAGGLAGGTGRTDCRTRHTLISLSPPVLPSTPSYVSPTPALLAATVTLHGSAVLPRAA